MKIIVHKNASQNEYWRDNHKGKQQPPCPFFGLVEVGIPLNDLLRKIIEGNEARGRYAKIKAGSCNKNKRFVEIVGANHPKGKQWNKPRKQQQKMKFSLLSDAKSRQENML